MTRLNHPLRIRGFTLVEMLVVLGIIAVLAALLLPAAMGAVTRARDAAIGFEVNQLASAIESYKQDKGDYPPNFRDFNVFLQHVRRCYPKIAPTELAWFFTYDSSGTLTGWKTGRRLDEGESLVFWLSHTTTDPRYPFGLTHPATATVTFKKYYEFDETRLETLDTSSEGALTGEVRSVAMPSYHAKHCKDTFYLYIDSRAYKDVAKFSTNPYRDPSPPGDTYAFAEDSSTEELRARPYWSDSNSTAYKNVVAAGGTPSGSLALLRDGWAPMNLTTFQILCAGQDGNFGCHAADTTGELDEDLKQFPSGSYYSNADKDNITNFSGGRRMEASAGKTK